MLSLLCVFVLQGAATGELAARVNTLEFHVDRLQAITVPADLQKEKATRLARLRQSLAAGAEDVEQFNALYDAIDEVRMWLWQHTRSRPAKVPGGMEETADAWVVTTPALKISLGKETLALAVATPKEVWRFGPSDEADVEIAGQRFCLAAAAERQARPLATGYSAGMQVRLSKLPGAAGFAVVLTLSAIGNEMVVDLAVRHEGAQLQAVNWPKGILLGNQETDLSVIPRMQGLLLPGNWPQEISPQVNLCNSRQLYMPWWGQIRSGHGVQTILETSADAGVAYAHPPGGPTRIAPRWYASLGRFAYLRTVRYVFDDAAGYVSMAKRYRRFVRERGHFVSLREKRVRTPMLDEVIGRPVIHLGALYHFVRSASLFNKDRIENNHSLRTFDQLAEGLRELQSRGIDDAYVHLDGWGFYGYDNGHPDVLPVGQEQGGWEGLRRFAETCDELGYLFAVHDQYRDFYLNAVSFDDRLTLTRLDGSREEHSTWCGGPQTILSPRFAAGYVRRNHDMLAAHGVKVRGAYLDVFAVVPLEQSAQPGHPLSRAACARYRRECFDLLRARGYVVSSEEPADYLVRSLDLVHHGPYATLPKIGAGAAAGIPVPLFNLVYHDSILLPWAMGEDGGWGIPRGDAGWLHCLLNAGLPYVSLGSSAAQITRVRQAADLARRCGLAEMTSHEFLGGGRRRQRTTFGDGTTVTVNFDTKEYSIEAAPVPLPRAHAHNDYRHERPLLDALRHGFCSVEADVFLVDDLINTDDLPGLREFLRGKLR